MSYSNCDYYENCTLQQPTRPSSFLISEWCCFISSQLFLLHMDSILPNVLGQNPGNNHGTGCSTVCCNHPGEVSLILSSAGVNILCIWYFCVYPFHPSPHNIFIQIYDDIRRNLHPQISSLKRHNQYCAEIINHTFHLHSFLILQIYYHYWCYFNFCEELLHKWNTCYRSSTVISCLQAVQDTGYLTSSLWISFWSSL